MAQVGLRITFASDMLIVCSRAHLLTRIVESFWMVFPQHLVKMRAMEGRKSVWEPWVDRVIQVKVGDRVSRGHFFVTGKQTSTWTGE